jgi:hypothetical protein
MTRRRRAVFAEAWAVVRQITVLDVLDILLIAFMIYSVILLIRDTKAYQAAVGLGLIGVLYLLTVWGRLRVSNRIIRSFINYVIIAVIVLFQAEIRRFLTEIGSRTFRKPFVLRSFQEKVDDLFQAVEFLSQKKIGALIAIEKEISSRPTPTAGPRSGRSCRRTCSSRSSSRARRSTTGRSSSRETPSSRPPASSPCRPPTACAARSRRGRGISRRSACRKRPTRRSSSSPRRPGPCPWPSRASSSASTTKAP